MSLYASVHHRLRVARLVAFVVAETAKTDEVNNDIFVKFAAVIESDLDHTKRCFGIIAVDVKYRCLRDVARVGRVDRTAAEAR